MIKKKMLFGIKSCLKFKHENQLSLRFGFLIIFIAGVLELSAQEPIAEIDLNTTDIRDIKGHISGDSLLFVYEERTGNFSGNVQKNSTSRPEEFRVNASWISSLGKKKLEIDEFNDKALVALIIDSIKTNYYFLEDKGNSVSIRSIVHRKNSIISVGSQGIEIPGRLLGSYVEKDLFILNFNTKNFSISVVQIKDAKVIKEKIYNLPFDIIKSKRTNVSFLNPASTPRPEHSLATVKIHKSDSTIFICRDEPFDEYDSKQRQYRTIVVKLQLRSGKYSSNVFVEPTKHPFTSIVFDNRLYRAVREEGLRLEVFDLTTGKQSLTKKFHFKDDYNDNLTYFRDVKKQVVGKENSVSGILKSFNPIYVIADSSSSKTVLTIGSRFEYETTVPIVSSFGIVGTVVSVMANVALHSLTEGPYIYSYFYLTGDPAKEFNFTNNTNLLRQKIDDYEIGLASTPSKFRLKGYLEGRNLIYAIYQEAKSKKIQISKFTK